MRLLPLLLPLVVGCSAAIAQPSSLAPKRLVQRFQLVGSVDAVALSDDRRLLAAAASYRVNRKGWSTESRISVFAVGTGKLVRSFVTRSDVRGLAFTNWHGRGLWSVGGEAENFGEVVRWDMRRGRPLKKFVWQGDWLTHMEVSRRKSQLAVISYGSMLLLNATTLRLQSELKLESGMDMGAAHYSPDGHFLVTTALGNERIDVQVWDTCSGRLVRTFSRPEGIGEVWFHDAHNRCFLTLDSRIEYRDAQTLRVVKSLWATPSSGLVFPSPSQKFISSGDADGNGGDAQNPYAVRVWKTATGKLLIKLTGHTDSIRSATFSRDERLLVSGDQRGRVNVWNIAQLDS